MGRTTRKKLLFDLDDTILDFRTAERTSIRRTFEAFSIPADEAVLRRYSEINVGCWQRLERGTMTREEVLVGRFELLFRELGIAASARAVQDHYEALLESGHYFVPGAPELLEELYPRYELYLISNGNLRTQEGRLKSAGISPFFKGIFISEVIGVNKPAKAFFDACFTAIPGCWFNPDGIPLSGSVRPDYEIHALGELPALLEEIFPE